jgi:AraC-like DNA-binding protein
VRSQTAIESICFSTRGMRPRERCEALRNLQQRGIMTVEPLVGRTPHAAIRKRFMPGVDILSGALSGLRQFGTQRGGDFDFLALNVEGESFARHRNREVTLSSGDAVLFSGADGGCTINRPTPMRLAALRIPYRALMSLVADPVAGGMRLIPKQSDPLRLLGSYLHAIDMGHALNSLELCTAVVSHIHDLIALSLGAGEDYQRFAEERSVAAARLQTVKADIIANLRDCALNVNGIALRHCVTPRYVQKLFANEGTTFSEYVLNQRLALAYQLLCEPRLSSRSISSVAFDIGFSDLSYFNRTFRRRYAATPSEVRAEGRLA